MRYALVNPAWSYGGSVYFGCREPHLPLEFGYAKALLEQAGHEAALIDAHLEGLTPAKLRARIKTFDPEIVVVATAPTSLFWRCPPPELSRPREAADLARGPGRLVVAVGPHASATPLATLRKLRADVAVVGECEEVLPRLAENAADRWPGVGSLAFFDRDGAFYCRGGPHETDMAALPPLSWPKPLLARHGHHHHRFDRKPDGPGAEVEASRGCPYHCAFCAKQKARNRYRVRPVGAVARELEGLLEAGVTYVYFIDEIFLPRRDLLEVLAGLPLSFGVQTRIDLWDAAGLEALGRAGCVSLEAGLESVTEAGRLALGKRCRLDTRGMLDLLARAKEHIPFVQANLLLGDGDDPDAAEAWRREALDRGVWANQPVPAFAYPGSPLYDRLFGDLAPDADKAWERAVAHYLEQQTALSDIQDQAPLPLEALERRQGAPA